MKYFYLPISFENDQIICLTALLPGFKQTPEYKFRKTAIAKNIIRTFNNRKEEETFQHREREREREEQLKPKLSMQSLAWVHITCALASSEVR